MVPGNGSMSSLATYNPFLIVSKQNRTNRSIQLAGKKKKKELSWETSFYEGIITQTTKYSESRSPHLPEPVKPALPQT